MSSFLLVGCQHISRRAAHLGIERQELLLDRVKVRGRATEKDIGIFFGRYRLASQVFKLNRISGPAQLGQPALKPCSGAPDEVGVEKEQDGDRGCRADRDPCEDLLEALHRRFPRNQK